MATWQDRLKIYSKDRDAATDEILRAKKVWEDEAKAYGKGFETTDRAKQIHNWANQVREASGVYDVGTRREDPYAPRQKESPQIERARDRLDDTDRYTPTAPKRPDFDYGKYMDDYFSEMERIQLARLRQAQQERQRALENQKNRVSGEYDKVIGDINLQKEQAAPRYHQARNQADAMYFDNAKRLEEMLANEGTLGGGKNVSANVGLMGQRLGAMNALDTQEQEYYAQADKAISDAMSDRSMRIAEIDDAIANLEAQGIDNESMIMAELRAERFRMEMEMRKFESQYDLQRYGMEMDYGFRREGMDLQRYDMEKGYDYKDKELGMREREYADSKEYRQWQQSMAEKEFQRALDNDAWNKSKDNPAVQYQMLQNAIASIDLQYLPQYKQLGLQQLQKEIAQIGRTASKPSDPMTEYKKAIELETAKIKLERLISGKDDESVDKYQKQLDNLRYGNPSDRDKVEYIGNLGKNGVSENVINQLLLLNGLPTNEKELAKIMGHTPAPTPQFVNPEDFYKQLRPQSMRR